MVHSLITQIGKTCGWLLLVLVFVQFCVVLARYVFNINYLWAQEAALYLHGVIFMLGAGWALLADKHVRIDVFATRFGGTGRQRIDLFGTLFLLLPMMGMIAFTSLGYVGESWSILEGSSEVSGLGGRYLFKSLIPLFAVLMMVTALTKIASRP